MNERYLPPLPHLNRRQLEIDALTTRAAFLLDQDRRLYRRHWEHYAMAPHRPWAELHALYSLKIEGVDLTAPPDTTDRTAESGNAVDHQAAALALMQLHFYHSQDYERCHWLNDDYIQALYKELVAHYTTTCQALQRPTPPAQPLLQGLTIIPPTYHVHSNYDCVALVHLASVHLLLYTLNASHLLIGPFVRLYTELAFGANGMTGCPIWGLPQALYLARERYRHFLTAGWSTDLRPGAIHYRLQVFTDWFLGQVHRAVNTQNHRLDQVRHP